MTVSIVTIHPSPCRWVAEHKTSVEGVERQSIVCMGVQSQLVVCSWVTVVPKSEGYYMYMLLELCTHWSLTTWYQARRHLLDHGS